MGVKLKGERLKRPPNKQQELKRKAFRANIKAALQAELNRPKR